jgi:hypothetical protein
MKKRRKKGKGGLIRLIASGNAEFKWNSKVLKQAQRRKENRN